ncbi:hypothetical protein VNO77_27359 [Canavalia gladiata]|uniref:Vacuolar protein sorting-associated protein 62 n=1 Tax=Canavalia gladiata TaxID=3824 RepID=A0AAN9KUJ3_CANGL
MATCKASKFLHIEDEKHYDSSAVYATALHSISLPFRMVKVGLTPDACSVSGAVDIHGVRARKAEHGVNSGCCHASTCFNWYHKMDVNVGISCVVLLWATLPTGVPAAASRKQFPGNFSAKPQGLPIETTFKLPGVIPAWPSGGNFSRGIIDLGGLQVSQISTFNKIWGAYGGGPHGQGFTMFEPSGIPEGFSTLGSYAQPNNKPLFGWVLVGKDVSTNSSNPTLKQPIDYTLIWHSISLDGPIYVWLPTPPNGYKAVGHVVTITPAKPSFDKIKCVRLDLTDQCETNSWIWGLDTFNVYDVRPINRGIQAPGVEVGTFVAQNGNSSSLSIACLKNTNALSTYMPNLQQIKAILQAYAPIMYLHSDEEYLPSSVNWFFSNGALLYKKGQESSPVPIAPNGTYLPQDPNNDGAYWLDLPADDHNKQRVKEGNLPGANSFVHVKPMLGGTFTDIATWVFYPFNGPARAKVDLLNIKLGKIGEHVGDWEHVTLRVSNFNGQLFQIYFSEHSKGKNKIGIRDDTDSGGKVMDLGAFELVAAEYLGSAVIEPPWLHFFREWGPKVEYTINGELKKIGKFLPRKLKTALEKFLNSLPSEILGEEGPNGPKGILKRSTSFGGGESGRHVGNFGSMSYQEVKEHDSFGNNLLKILLVHGTGECVVDKSQSLDED